MNERIKELAKQAGFYVSYDDKIYTPTISEDITDCQTRFTELIVQECADLCSDLDGGENMFSRGIHKHFGVE